MYNLAMNCYQTHRTRTIWWLFIYNNDIGIGYKGKINSYRCQIDDRYSDLDAKVKSV